MTYEYVFKNNPQILGIIFKMLLVTSYHSQLQTLSSITSSYRVLTTGTISSHINNIHVIGIFLIVNFITLATVNSHQWHKNYTTDIQDECHFEMNVIIA